MIPINTYAVQAQLANDIIGDGTPFWMLRNKDPVLTQRLSGWAIVGSQLTTSWMAPFMWHNDVIKWKQFPR